LARGFFGQEYGQEVAFLAMFGLLDGAELEGEEAK
jgi:hypothetical protein